MLVQQVIDNNRSVITEYLQALQVETNASANYTKLTKTILKRLSEFYKDKKAFRDMKRNDIVAYFNSLRKTDKQDPMHKWIGTYNNYLIGIGRFFKWLENPNLEPSARLQPQRMLNIPRLRRKETSVYKPSDLWTLEDDLLFLKICANDRDKCYHAISRDMSARPHEILALRIKDIIFKTVGDKQFAEVSVKGLNSQNCSSPNSE